jgi:fructose transport system ATP-binding protein
VSPSLDIADNLFLGREPRAPEIMVKVYRKLDPAKMRAEATKQMTELGIMTIQDISQQVESLSGGQRQGVAVARAAAFGSKVIVLDEPPAALGVKPQHAARGRSG